VGVVVIVLMAVILGVTVVVVGMVVVVVGMVVVVRMRGSHEDIVFSDSRLLRVRRCR
jgi:uncharacterized membrane protein HdeD (DUF308 family)